MNGFGIQKKFESIKCASAVRAADVDQCVISANTVNAVNMLMIAKI